MLHSCCPGVISTRMNHFDSEAVSLSCRNESHTPVASLFCVERCVFMFPRSPALSQFAPNDNVICQAGMADSQMEKNGSHMWGSKIIYCPQMPGDMSCFICVTAVQGTEIGFAWPQVYSKELTTGWIYILYIENERLYVAHEGCQESLSDLLFYLTDCTSAWSQRQEDCCCDSVKQSSFSEEWCRGMWACLF